MVYTLMNQTLPMVVSSAVITRTIDTTMGRSGRGGGTRRKTATRAKKVKVMAVAVARTRAEAETKAEKYIKAGHRGIKKQSGVYRGRKYNYVVYVK